MKLSTKTRYGLRMLIELGKSYQKGPVQLNLIAKKENISEKYLGQIVIRLRKAGIVSSVRGAGGGYFLEKAPEKLNLLEIFEALEGGISLVDCQLPKEDACPRSGACKSFEVWEILSNSIAETLKNMKLSELLDDRASFADTAESGHKEE